MDRKAWTDPITMESLPAWNCPACKEGRVLLVPETFQFEETAESKASHDIEGWDPDWITYGFIAWGECSHIRCRQKFAISGTGSVDTFYCEDGPDWNDVFRANACFPMPDMFEIPKKCPTDIAEELRAAFTLFLVNRGACASRLRVVLELLMDALKIPKEGVNDKKKEFTLSLHARIEKFTEQNAVIGGHLMALKWLGNTGAHESSVSRHDLLDAFELLEHVLSEVIDEQANRREAMARKMRERHGNRC